jgi:DNA-binding NarL/FixJ family response regulator
MASAMKILLVDDHALFREGLVHVLQRLAEKVEVLQAADTASALRLAEQHADLALALLDLRLADGSGLDILSELHALQPRTPIVMLSGSELRKDIRLSLSRGARGYITKSSTAQVMLTALQLVLSGGVYIPPAMLDGADLADDAHHAVRDGDGGMTPRQLDVLSLLAEGQSNKEIARSLDMADGTVRTHVNAIFRVLNVVNRTQAVNEARRRGLLS